MQMEEGKLVCNSCLFLKLRSVKYLGYLRDISSYKWLASSSHRLPVPPRKDSLQSVSRTDWWSCKEQYKCSSSTLRRPSAQRPGVGKSVSESTGDREKRGALLSLKSSDNLDTFLPSPFPALLCPSSKNCYPHKDSAVYPGTPKAPKNQKLCG